MKFKKPFTLLFIQLLVYISFLSIGQTIDRKFTWIDPLNHLHHEIDISNGTYRTEVKPGLWILNQSVSLNGIDLNNLPKDFTIQHHATKHGMLFNVPGTGLLYSFNPKLNQLTRLDKTFFKGFNFHSFSFMKNDTLYSIGGEGFWSTNSTLIYYDQKNQEWEKKFTKNKGPGSIEWDFGGYSNLTNSFYALEGKEEFKSNNFHEKSMYQLDLNNLEWKELGTINTDLFTNQNQVNQFKYWLGDFFLYLDGFVTKAYILDPINNKILEYTGNNIRLKKGIREAIRDKDWIYIYQHDSKEEKLDSISVKDLLLHSKEVGKMYHPKSMISKEVLMYLMIAFLLILSAYLLINNRQKNLLISHINKPLSLHDLPEHLLNVLAHFKNQGLSTLLSTNEMNELLSIKMLSFDSSRQQRSRDLKAINDFFLINYNIPDAIARTNSDKDKRITYYKMNEKAYKVVEKLELENLKNKK